MCHYKRVVAVRTAEKHTVAIRVVQSLSKIAMYEHRCLKNIKKLYKSAGIRDDKKRHKAIIEASMVSTPKGFTENSIM